MDQHDPAYNKNTTSFGVYANKYFEQRQYELKVEYIASLLLEYEYDKKIATQNPQTLNKFNYMHLICHQLKKGVLNIFAILTLTLKQSLLLMHQNVKILELL